MFSKKEISRFFFEYPTIVTPFVIGSSIGLSQLYQDILGELSVPVLKQLLVLSYSGETKHVHY
jgi:hypothetical protein